MKRFHLAALLVSFMFMSATAQTSNEIGEKLKDLHIEAGIGLYTPSHSTMATDVSIGAIYQFTPRFSAQILSTGQYFIPKNGVTHDYNYAFGLGGGIGFAPLPIDPSDFGVYEIRANITAPIGNSDYKNMGYGLGIYWRGTTHGKRHLITPFVGVEYRIHDFTADGLKTFKGFYMTFGLRF